MKTTRIKTPNLEEIVADTARHAAEEEWGLRKAMEHLHDQLEELDGAAAFAVEHLLNITEANEAEDQRRIDAFVDSGEDWEGRNNG